ncbi:unnamed protein product, partial [Pelagomonas calceolata]
GDPLLTSTVYLIWKLTHHYRLFFFGFEPRDAAFSAAASSAAAARSARFSDSRKMAPLIWHTMVTAKPYAASGLKSKRCKISARAALTLSSTPRWANRLRSITSFI